MSKTFTVRRQSEILDPVNGSIVWLHKVNDLQLN
jgi:hypothetical protein